MGTEVSSNDGELKAAESVASRDAAEMNGEKLSSNPSLEEVLLSRRARCRVLEVVASRASVSLLSSSLSSSSSESCCEILAVLGAEERGSIGQICAWRASERREIPLWPEESQRITQCLKWSSMESNATADSLTSQLIFAIV